MECLLPLGILPLFHLDYRIVARGYSSHLVNMRQQAWAEGYILEMEEKSDGKD